MRFASDNTAGAAPEVLDALLAANAGAAASYGDDAWTARVEARLCDLFEHECKALLVTTGTAANALALSTLVPAWGAVMCHRDAHIERDECGAPEFFGGGAKLALVEGPDGRIDPTALRRAIERAGLGDVHRAQPKALSLTQATEAGTLYPADDLAALADIARGYGLCVHLDGTRFANALARTGATPADLSWRAGVDVLCLGATKGGALAAEAIICFDTSVAEELAFRRKRAGHLLSKMRFVAAQMEAWLADGLWLRLATHANAMADRLAAGLMAAPGVEIVHPVEANMLFARLSPATHAALQAADADYSWEAVPDGPAGGVLARLVCAHTTTPEEVDRCAAIACAAA